MFVIRVRCSASCFLVSVFPSEIRPWAIEEQAETRPIALDDSSYALRKPLGPKTD
jgi:hypothetical protein